jgi:2-keto-3-deoxy-L-rhamnonate aldolase RhmA
MGLDTTQDPRVEEATRHVMQAAQTAGKVIGMAVGSTLERDKYRAMGARWMVQASDQTLLRQAAQAITQRAPLHP